MAGYIKIDVDRVETSALNTKINKEVFDNFKICCKQMGYPLNVMLETFMRQYTNGKFVLSADDILKYKSDKSEVDTLNTTFNKEIYLSFKSTCKNNGFFVRHVVTAFMEKFVNGNFILEYVDVDKAEE